MIHRFNSIKSKKKEQTMLVETPKMGGFARFHDFIAF